jgi:hypothetical protein
LTTAQPMKPQPPVISTRPPIPEPTAANLSRSRLLRREQCLYSLLRCAENG